MDYQVEHQINSRLMAANSILLISHKKPDGDACGSLLAMQEYLTSFGKQAEIYVADPAPMYYDFLPNFEKIKSDVSVLSRPWDLVVILDVGGLDHAKVSREIFAGVPIINIDHHWTNTLYGDLNLVMEGASSTSEVVFNFFKVINYSIPKNSATGLLAGILDDTGGFSNSATSFGAMAIAAELIKRGARINKISDHLNKNQSFNGLKLWGLVLSRLKVNRDLNLAYTYILENDFRDFDVSEDEVDGVANFLNILSEVAIAMVLKISEHQTKVSLRTKRDDINVAALAKLFGGGGHKKAAGFTVPWPIKESGGKLII